MKIDSILLTVFTSLVLESCITSYYQVYKALPEERLTISEDHLVYEDENCKVYYDFWAENGNIGFRFHNKTEKNIYLNLAESYFVLNGVAYDYYQNRIFEKSEGAGSSVSNVSTVLPGFLLSAGYSISYKEKEIVCIPSMTSKIITEYSINQTLFRHCDLFRYPTKNQIKTKYYSKQDSPIVFSNRLLYTLEGSENPIKFENEFYVAEITNYPESEMFEMKNDVFCGEKSAFQTKYFKNISPDKFYIKYTREQDSWKH